METHSGILAWRIPWTEEPGRLQSIASQSWTQLNRLSTHTCKGTFHAQIGSINNKKGKNLTEAEEIKKRWEKYTKLYKKALNDPDNRDGVVTHIEPDILEC